jgi:hypothetical protein
MRQKYNLFTKDLLCNKYQQSTYLPYLARILVFSIFVVTNETEHQNPVKDIG